MKRIIKLLFVILLITPIFGVFNGQKIKAEVACELFEVANANDDGSFSKIDCYNTIEEATEKMHENKDYVVRHNASQSPMKIVAMNSGFAYAYPYRSGTNTQSIYENLDINHKGSGASTYVTVRYEMTYHETSYFYINKDNNACGWVYITLNGFTGHTDLENVDLVPTKFVEKGISITLGGNDRYTYEDAYQIKMHQNYYYVKKNGNYNDLVFKFYRTVSKDGEAVASEVAYGVAPDFMEAGKKYYSSDGVNFYNDGLLTKYVGTYYNYYQFLPLRTKTNISADTMNAFISQNASSDSVLLNTGLDFIKDQNEFGCNAATILSMAIHESAWGSSTIAKGKYNLFGWGAFDSATTNATRYESVKACVKAQMGDNLSNYMDPGASVYFSSSLGNKGGGFITKYASDPYWAEKIASYYYRLDKYANNNNGNLSDYNTYTLAYVKEPTAVKKEANDSSETLYNTNNKTGYQKNVIVVVFGEENGYAKIQSFNPINDNGVVSPITLAKGTIVPYDFNKSIGYIKSSKLIPLNGEIKIEEPDVQIDPNSIKTFGYIEDFGLKENTITIKGYAAITGLNTTNKVKHQIVFKDYEDKKKEYVYDATTFEANKILLNDGFDYSYCGYNASINLRDIPNGNYVIYVRVNNNSYTKDIEISSSDDKYANLYSTYKGYTNRVTENEAYGYRLELEISETPIIYSNINKPSTRTSLFSPSAMNINDGKLYFKCIGLIYYVNFDNASNIEYNVYLIKNATDYIKTKGTIVDNAIDYKKSLNSSYNMDYITFECEMDVSKLSGKYNLVLEIKNKSNGNTYIDYIEMNNIAGFKMPSNTFNGKIYKITKENARDRMVLDIGG